MLDAHVYPAHEDDVKRHTTHITITLILLAGAALVAALTLRGWPTALMPLAMFLCVVCLPLLGFGLFARWQLPELELGWLDGLLWAAQAALWCVLLGWWAAPAVRMQAARHAPQRALAACLMDPDGSVVRTCCEQLGQAAVSHQAELGRWLIDNERVPMACAVQAFDGQTAAANSTARILVERWEAQLLSARETPAAPQATPADPAMSQEPIPLCELASYMRHMDRVPGVHSGLRLLQCALRATHPEARQCCAAQLHQLEAQSGDWTNALGPAAMTQRTDQASRLLLLLPQLLNPPDERASDQLRAMGLDTAEARRWSLSAACSLLEDESPRVRAEAGAHLQLTLFLHGCEEITGLEPRTLRRVCASWAEQAQPKPTVGGDEQQLCEVARGEALNRAAQYARAFMTRGRSLGRAAAKSEEPMVRAILSARGERHGNGGNNGIHMPDQLMQKLSVVDTQNAVGVKQLEQMLLKAQTQDYQSNPPRTPWASPP
jgi:hypothetical protein